MIRSMTGFGSARLETDRYTIRIEARAVNNRSFKLSCRLPEAFAGREMEIERIFREEVSRGTVYVVLEFEDLAAEPPAVIDEQVLRRHHAQLTRLKSELGDPAPVRLEALLTLPGVMSSNRRRELSDVLWDETTGVLREARQALIGMREKEGAHLWAQVKTHGERVLGLLDTLDREVPGALQAYRKRLSERLAALLDGKEVGLEPGFIEREVALLAERSDVSEEAQRLRSHIEQMLRLEDDAEPCGRKLEFIVQEMFREANTLASKSCNDALLRDALEIKNEIDKLREQAQNVE